jgi:hypothetical protein
MGERPGKSKFTEHPIWSSLIVTGIVSPITTFIPGGWKWVGERLSDGANWLALPITMPQWMFFLICAVAGLLALRIATQRIAKVMNAKKDPAHWYEEDKIFGIKWRWKWEGGVTHLGAFCPQCDLQISPENASAYRAVSHYCMRCPDCDVTLHEFYCDPDEFIDQVKLRIQQRARAIA